MVTGTNETYSGGHFVNVHTNMLCNVDIYTIMQMYIL